MDEFELSDFPDDDLIDADQDGRDDTVLIDDDADGTAEAIFTDLNEDGVLDAGIVDTDDDGVADLFVADRDQNGTLEEIVVDADRDGFLDVGGQTPDLGSTASSEVAPAIDLLGQASPTAASETVADTDGILEPRLRLPRPPAPTWRPTRRRRATVETAPINLSRDTPRPHPRRDAGAGARPDSGPRPAHWRQRPG